MASIPTPRSFSQLFQDQQDSFLGRTGLTAVKIGSPTLSLFESAAQSDLRNTQDIFNLLSATGLDSAEGQAVDKIGEDEKVPRILASPSSGSVTITDSRYTRVASSLYQGQGAPVAGSSSIYLANAAAFPASGRVYIGRGTSNYEGPLNYTAVTNLGTYWRLDLQVGNYTTRFHNVNESVILAQGGDRLIRAGTQISTPQGNFSTSVTVGVQYQTKLADGEVSISAPVIATRPGLSSRVPAGALTVFASLPFTGATVTNPLPFTNGVDTEQDGPYKERIRAARASRSKGTDLALTTSLLGVTSIDENKRIASASLVDNLLTKTSTIYIDDGTGYEERSEGITQETLVDSALGGEDTFQLAASRPVTKAFLQTPGLAPWTLISGSVLAVKVGGVMSTHRFPSSDFRLISAASAYEIVASINSDSLLLFNARTGDSGTSVIIQGKGDTLEDLEVSAPTDGSADANLVLGFPSGRVDTLRLYRNDQLLTKDGKPATLLSAPQSSWANMVSPQTLTMSVDGTPSATYTFTDADFVSAGTGYASLSNTNSLSAWARVLNSKIPGITATVLGNQLSIVSNRGRTPTAALSISGGSLIGNSVFRAIEGLASAGVSNDYVFNRSLGEVQLLVPALAGDKITSGTTATREFVESAALTTVNILAPGATFWFAIDGDVPAQIISTGLNTTTSVTVSAYVPAPPVTWGQRVRFTVGAGAPFVNVLAGDWAIFMDTNFSAPNQGAWRVDRVDGGGTWFEVSKSSLSAQTVTLNSGGITFVRSSSQLQPVTIAAATNYTASSLVDAFNASLRGATAEVYRTTQIRVRTNNYATGGSIALVAANVGARQLGMPILSATGNDVSHMPTVVSANTDTTGTPAFRQLKISSVASGTNFTLAAATGLDVGQRLTFLKDLPDIDSTAADDRVGTNKGKTISMSSLTGAVVTTNDTPLEEWLPADRLYGSRGFDLSPFDELTVIVDQDTSQHRYAIPMWRQAKPSGTTYSAVVAMNDANNSNLSLATAFGTGFRWTDFAVHMHARTKSHAEAGDTTATVLWRSRRIGPDGNSLLVRYVYPDLPSQPVSVSLEAAPVQFEVSSRANVALASGTARTGVAIRNTTRVGITLNTVGSLETLTYFLGLPIVSATRSGSTVTLTLNTTTPAITDHGLQIGDSIWVQTTSANFLSGIRTITARAPSTISYLEAGAAVTEANIGTISFDTAGEAKFGGSTVVVGDIVAFNSASSMPSLLCWQGLRVNAIGNQYVQMLCEDQSGTNLTISWFPVGNAAGFSAFPLATNTAASVATAVNAITSATNPLTAVAVGVGGVNTGTITQASFEQFTTFGYAYALSDGLNYVQSTTVPGSPSIDYTFTLKTPVTASLATNSDWINEEVRLVPQTARNWADYLSTFGVSGLPSAATIETTIAGGLQFTSLTQGSAGAIQVQAGTGNATSASAIGSATRVGNYMDLSAPTAAVTGLTAGMSVRLQNTSINPKSVFNSGTGASVAADGTFTLTGTQAWTYANSATGLVTNNWQVEKQGRFVAMVWAPSGTGAYAVAPSLAGIQEGDWMTVLSGGGMNNLNVGQFRIVRVNDTDHTIWFENANALEQVGVGSLFFTTANSIMPGDLLRLGTDTWGAANKGEWKVKAINNADPTTFQVDVSTKATTVFAGPGTLGASAPLAQVYESQPRNFVKSIVSVLADPLDPTLSTIKFTTWQGYGVIGEAQGTLISAMDKLAFPAGVHVGVDGYQHSIGLIGEAARVIFGDAGDTDTYPGVAAANSNINLSGPFVKRARVSIGIRTRAGNRPGIDNRGIIEQVRSSVASLVNSTGVGQPLSLEKILGAAGKISGVVSTVLLYPTFGLGNDLLPVQGQEKVLILDLDTDIQVSIIGD